MAGDASALAPSSARPPAGLVAQYGGAQGAGRDWRRGEMTSATEPRRAVPPIREALLGRRSREGSAAEGSSRLPLFSQSVRTRYLGAPRLALRASWRRVVFFAPGPNPSHAGCSPEEAGRLLPPAKALPAEDDPSFALAVPVRSGGRVVGPGDQGR